MSAGTIRLDFPRASVSPGFWARPSVPARPDVRQSVEVVASTSSAVARPASRLARWLPLVLRPLLGAFLLAASLFVVQASGVVPGFAPQAALACGGTMTDADYWLQSNYVSQKDWSNTRTVFWDAHITGTWCYTYHYASYNGGGSWFPAPTNTGWQTITTITTGADGYANALIGNSLLYKSCTGNGMTGTCSPAAGGAMNNNLFIDTQTPSSGSHIDKGDWGCYAPGQGVVIGDGGSSDPNPSSGWPWGGGMWRYSSSWGANSGWQSAGGMTWTPPRGMAITGWPRKSATTWETPTTPG